MSDINSLIALHVELTDEKKRLNQSLKDLDERLGAVEDDLLAQMDEVGAKEFAGDSGKAVVSEQTFPSVQDWEQVYKYMRDNDAMYLLQKRLSATAYKELTNLGEAVPGVVPFSKPKLSVRST